MIFKRFFKKQLSTVIEWKEQDKNKIFYRYPSLTDEIKHASKLIVAPGEGCLVVYNGKVQDVLTEPGIYFLKTDNHPFITNLLKLRQAFSSEHKMYLYFFRTAELVNQKWGTATPIKYMDSVYNFPVELGIYGNFSVKIVNAQNMFTNFIGSTGLYTAENLRSVLTPRITPLLIAQFAKAKYSYQNIDTHLAQMSGSLKEELSAIFIEFGLELTDFRIEGSSFNQETENRINTIAKMTSEALSAAEVGLSYVELEKLRALRDAAQNEGGLAGAGLQLGAGLELGKSFMAHKDLITPAAVTSADDGIEYLRKLKLLFDEGILTEEEFNQKKKDLLDKI